MIAINGRQCYEARLLLPWQGSWVCRLKLDGAVPSGRVTVTWGTSTLIGTVDPSSSGVAFGAAETVVVGGLAWASSPVASWQQNDAGLPLSSVATALARAIGEPLAVDTKAFRLAGASYARAKEPASHTMARLLAPGAAWWVELDGSAKTGVRPAPAAHKGVQVLDWRPRRRWARLGAEDLSQIVIGSVVPAQTERHPALRIRDATITADASGENYEAVVEVAA